MRKRYIWDVYEQFYSSNAPSAVARVCRPFTNRVGCPGMPATGQGKLDHVKSAVHSFNTP
ncbi:hypothetical protein JI435_417750 [Parastagonospora nodorum SN15]|uniref:Uncharacterized protein n=1 Tax=Phaeosphaeria nodorum (strain SN15 / ATCC MYA-4574 / FGSC 10173) TaxID=321614 RepID=A0A7U2FDM4_PHANO|nr:hypothetical protein JI435_417750 [Parastagonospora nodorum SN15]